jgi:hypothetical protein
MMKVKGQGGYVTCMIAHAFSTGKRDLLVALTLSLWLSQPELLSFHHEVDGEESCIGEEGCHASLECVSLHTSL